MDSSFIIKPPPGVQKYAPRDPVRVREAVEADSNAIKPTGKPDEHGQERGNPHHDPHHEPPPQPHHEHVPHDVVTDPASREVINRENDVRAQADGRPHPDQALLRYRAYQAPRSESDNTPPVEPHANIKA